MGRPKRASSAAAAGKAGAAAGAPSRAGPATPPPPAPAAALPLSPVPPARLAKRRRSSKASSFPAQADTAEAAAAAAAAALEHVPVEAAIPLAAATPDAASAALEDVAPAELEVRRAEEGAGPAGRRPPRRSRAPAAAPQAAQAEDGLVEGEGAEEGSKEEEVAGQPKKKRGGRRRVPDPPPLKELPTAELVARLTSEGYRPPPLPVPNLGYACLNMDLRELKPPIFTSRDCIKRTMDEKGLPYLGELALANCRDLAMLIQWNHEHGIRVFRMSSVLFPWMGTFDATLLPQYEEISAALHFAGDLARLYGQRITFHPSHFVKLGTADDVLAGKSRRELEVHSKIMDLMGFEPSPINKINIHVGGTYATLGSKEDTMRRWAANFAKLSPACRKRMTVENDDIASAFSTRDLLFLHSLCGVPIVFDFHHHKFCPGNQSEREALLAAVATWPPGVRPLVHWSESQAGRKPHAHSDYVRGPIFLHGLEGQVDIMIEAKCKERALLAYRGDIPMPETPAEGEEEAEEAAVAADCCN